MNWAELAAAQHGPNVIPETEAPQTGLPAAEARDLGEGNAADAIRRLDDQLVRSTDHLGNVTDELRERIAHLERLVGELVEAQQR